MKNIIIFLGLPASGKGTQATLLKEKLNYENLSTGYLLRKEVEKKTELGNKIAEIINAGNLVSDELIFEILKNNMKDIETNGFILDGFPRTLKQAEMLSNYLDNNKELKLQKVFLINIDDKVVIERVCDRISCNKCGATYNHTSKKPKVEGVCDICGSTELVDRSDDLDAEAVKKRINIFKENINDITSFYEKKSLIFSLDGLKDIDTINLTIMKALSD